MAPPSWWAGAPRLPWQPRSTVNKSGEATVTSNPARGNFDPVPSMRQRVTISVIAKVDPAAALAATLQNPLQPIFADDHAEKAVADNNVGVGVVALSNVRPLGRGRSRGGRCDGLGLGAVCFVAVTGWNGGRAEMNRDLP